MELFLNFLADYWFVVMILGWGFTMAIVSIINAIKGCDCNNDEDE